MLEKGHKINVGRKLSEETKKKIRDGNIGKVKSLETIERQKQTKLKKKLKKLEEYMENPKYCRCGCGKIVIPDLAIPGLRIHDYIEGHYTRIGKQNPTYGKERNKKWREKIGKANSGNIGWCKELTKYNNKSLMNISIRMSKNNPSTNPEINGRMLKTKVERGSHISGAGKAAETRKERGTGKIGAKKGVETRHKLGTTGGGRCKWIQYDGKKVQGNFELKFVKFLDSIGIEWESHKGIETFKYIGADGKEHYYQPDIKDKNGNYYDPHSKYYWDEKFEYKISEVRKNNPDKKFIVFHEENYLETCKMIIDWMEK